MSHIHINNNGGGGGFPHLLHFILTLLTCGAWLPIWVLHRLFSDR